MFPIDIEDLRRARMLLENPGLAAKITGALGSPIEKGLEMLPPNWAKLVEKGSKKALEVAADSAVFSLAGGGAGKDAANLFHKLMVAGVGAAGGFWGLPALALELPVSTTVMLRSIADIARSEGHCISDPAVKVNCIEVFALGGPSAADNALDTGYFAVRTALAMAVNDAVKHLAARGVGEGSAPILVKLIGQIASRFGTQVTEKIAAQSIPIIGALGGAVINTLFIDHFQNMARGHFIILRLESSYGQTAVRQQYDALGQDRQGRQDR